MAAATRSQNKTGAETISHGAKRRRANNDTAMSKRLRLSIHPSPSPSLVSDDLEHFEDDSDTEYEYIRIPKKRDWDIFRVPREEPKDRDKTELPLIAINCHGQRVIMWAQMDTGADTNVINRSTVEALLGAEEAQKQVREIPEVDFKTLGSGRIEARNTVKLSFTVGASKRTFTDIEFIVLDDDPEAARSDGIPDVLLGFPLLHAHHMLMMDIEYCHDLEPEESGLKVIAKRFEEERESAGGIRTLRLEQQKGVPRPKK